MRKKAFQIRHSVLAKKLFMLNFTDLIYLIEESFAEINNTICMRIARTINELKMILLLKSIDLFTKL